ncbi:MAG: DUF6524 family protein [Pseudomonadota bacterium]
MARSSFGFFDFAQRWIFAQILVLATFNPTDYSYYRWAMSAFETELPLVIFLGLVLLIGYVIFVRATLRSIGVIGILLILALAGSLLWFLIDRGLLSLEDVDFLTWIGLIGVGLILGIGMSWSHIRRMLSGQLDVDDVDT